MDCQNCHKPMDPKDSFPNDRICDPCYEAHWAQPVQSIPEPMFLLRLISERSNGSCTYVSVADMAWVPVSRIQEAVARLSYSYSRYATDIVITRKDSGPGQADAHVKARKRRLDHNAAMLRHRVKHACEKALGGPIAWVRIRGFFRDCEGHGLTEQQMTDALLGYMKGS